MDPAALLRQMFEEDDEEEDERRKKRRRDEVLSAQMDLALLLLESETPKPTPKREITRSCKKDRGFQAIDKDGKLFALTPKTSFWYTCYVLNGDNMNQKSLRKFRNRFRLPYENFLELVNELEESGKFDRWKEGSADKFGVEASPLSLLLLGALRYLGRGWTFDDIEEATAINAETVRQFFHKFIEYGSTDLYEKHVVTPTTAEDAEAHICDFHKAGFPGCVSSTDATHVSLENCSHRLKHIHKGFKLSLPSRTYNISVNHRRRILHSTSGHPASWNDKTLQRFDTFMEGVKSGESLPDVLFYLDDITVDGEIIAVKYQGTWQMVDNGYIKVPTAIPPSKNAVTFEELRWSQWLESMRKDVECTFGILKARWRILKTAIRLLSLEKVDQVWLTCCALHNWLLEIDEYDIEYGGVNQSSNPSFSELTAEDIPFALERLETVTECDLSGQGGGRDMAPRHDSSSDSEDEENFDVPIDQQGTNVVRNLKFESFRAKLITHFDIQHQKKALVWPVAQGNTKI